MYIITLLYLLKYSKIGEQWWERQIINFKKNNNKALFQSHECKNAGSVNIDLFIIL